MTGVLWNKNSNYSFKKDGNRMAMLIRMEMAIMYNYSKIFFLEIRATKLDEL